MANTKSETSGASGDPRDSNQAAHLKTVLDWVNPISGDEARRAGHHALQVATDTIAYSHNIPVRLLLLDRLKEMPRVIASLLEQPEVRSVLRAEAQDLSPENYTALVEHFDAARDWIVSMAETSPFERPRSLPRGWEAGILALQPHIERKIWLTEICNPLPAHSLCRMQDRWSLYILMWCQKSASRFVSEEPIYNALGIDGLVVRSMKPFRLKAREGVDHTCVTVIGPIFEGKYSASQNSHNAFCNTFYRFVEEAQEGAWGDGSYATPSREELTDALEARIDLSVGEAELRSRSTEESLALLLRTKIARDAPDNGFLSRANWETAAVLCSWLVRWKKAIEDVVSKTEPLILSHLSHRVAISATFRAVPAGESTQSWDLVLVQSDRSSTLSDWIDSLDLAAGTSNAHRIDRPEIYFNRTRERQNAAWYAQIIAINNLLNRHGSKETFVPDALTMTSVNGCKEDEAGHLLRGYGGRICRHLVSITRADLADIYWLDYSQAPPRLIHAGGYKRVAAHRAERHAICKTFDEWAWRAGPQLSNRCPANMGRDSPSQAYRVAAFGIEDPLPNQPGERKTIVAFSNNREPNVDEAPAYFGGFPSPTPCDAISVPLLVNGRVVGVITLAGLVPRQFDPRLFVPLRRAASLVATCMYHQSQLWQMRRLNSMFAHKGRTDSHRREENDESNILQDIAKCLANIFLCRVAHIWLRSKADDDRYELRGYNWPEIFGGHTLRKGRPIEFRFEPSRDNVRDPKHDAFAGLTIDLFKKDQALCLGRFIQGQYDPSKATTENFDAVSAETRGSVLGKDFLPNILEDTNNPDFIDARTRIFDAYALRDLMAFVLVRPKNESEWEIVGVVTLHDKGDWPNGHSQRMRPWDHGWSPVVAHVQTYLPYLLTQDEVLNNPVVDARRYLIHAGRAELIAVLDSTIQMRNLLENTLAPDRGARSAINQVMARNFKGDYRAKLAGAEISLTAAWAAVESLTSPVWEQNLTQLANVMHDYRDLAKMQVEIGESNANILVEVEIKRLIHSYEHQLRRDGVFTDSDIPSGLRLDMPKLWFAIIFGDLIHNAAKYATSGQALDVLWIQKTRTLYIRNEGRFRSDVDNSKSLLKYGVRGSAKESERILSKHESTAVDRRGKGLGLWGAALLCRVMNIKFGLDIRPKEATLKTVDNGVREGLAAYEVSVTFPVGMVTQPIAAGPDFY